jgi:hypothetical protein
MASPTKKKKVRKILKKASVGRERKNANRLHGTTQASLALNVPNAAERAQIAARAK